MKNNLVYQGLMISKRELGWFLEAGLIQTLEHNSYNSSSRKQLLEITYWMWLSKGYYATILY